uniref:Uncharacterized protein n=1 Tax=Solanum lycopersicum TaxID=4081 RepID=A0A3Q7GJD1_SOLLC
MKYKYSQLLEIGNLIKSYVYFNCKTQNKHNFRKLPNYLSLSHFSHCRYSTSPTSTAVLLRRLYRTPPPSPHSSINFSYSRDSKWDRCCKVSLATQPSPVLALSDRENVSSLSLA